ncbi:DUF4837 family protein [Cesiribacter sp. SM1]|uniref:DUF4837 family protein n=1 Tax=Cesiribacter sp. SM1 TaxID=2861196 RepID=UPI001CD6DB62|nr:DUF4837 family protein [Cesiribacter sp. SM1]
MNYKALSLWLFAIITVCISCGDGENKNTTNRDFLPRASLVPNEILVVMDSSQWNGVLGEAIRDVFTEPIPGLPQEEPYFKVSHIQPQDLRGFLKRYPNILFAFTLDNNSRATEMLKTMFSERSLEQIQNEPQRYMATRKDEFAKGQEVMYLFANSEEQLTSRIYSSRDQLLNYFRDVERQRSIREYSQVKVTRPLSDMLSQQYGFSLRFPAGYEVAKQDSNFVWIRLLDNQVDKSIWATWKPYTGQEAFERENIIEYRNTVAKQYIWGDQSDTYMRLENQLPVSMEEVNFNGRFAVETRGLWRLEKMIMGGPFISYTFVDEATNRLYYLEGFVYAPGQDKRAAMSELEAILWTFKSAPQQKK